MKSSVLPINIKYRRKMLVYDYVNEMKTAVLIFMTPELDIVSRESLPIQF